jgi:hypothetical protein
LSLDVDRFQPAQILELQRTAGNEAVVRLLGRTTGARQPIVQRVKDFSSSGVPRGTGLTPSTPSPLYGRWHIHVIMDDDGLDLVGRMFLKFEERDPPQHLQIDQDGNVVDTALWRQGSPAATWGMATLKAFYKGCTTVPPLEIEQRRREKAEKEARDKEAMDKLAPLKMAEKHEYTGSQAGLFGSQSLTMSDDAAILLLNNVGITRENNRDFMMIKAKVKSGDPKERWLPSIQHHYDAIYPPIVSSASSAILEIVAERGEGQEESPTPEPKKPKKVDGPTVVDAVRNEVVVNANPRGVGPALLRIGVPAALLILLVAVFARFFLMFM